MRHPLLTRIGIAYMSVFLIIATLICAKHFVTQNALDQEVVTRNLASTMSLQELRTQAAFRNALLSIIPASQLGKYNSLGVDPVMALTKNVSDIEHTNAILIGESAPASVSGKMRLLQRYFGPMDVAAHAVLSSDKAQNEKGAAQEVATMWAPEQQYLSGTYAAYQDLTASADEQIAYIMNIENILLVISLLTLCFEAGFIAWPLLRDHSVLRKEVVQLQAEATRIKEEIYAKEDENREGRSGGGSIHNP